MLLEPTKNLVGQWLRSHRLAATLVVLEWVMTGKFRFPQASAPSATTHNFRPIVPPRTLIALGSVYGEHATDFNPDGSDYQPPLAIDQEPEPCGWNAEDQGTGSGANAASVPDYESGHGSGWATITTS